MAINFAAASTAGLNNPGTEIITLVKDGSGNFINPPSYDKMRTYLSSGDVPMLFVTDEGGKTGDIYQFSGYSEAENKIRFAGGSYSIEFNEVSGVSLISNNIVPLAGSTEQLTPTEVMVAVLSGRPVRLSHPDGTYGALIFTSFNIATSANVIVANTIIDMPAGLIAYIMTGNTATNTWIGKGQILATS